MASSAVRSFAITLAIAITTVGPRASGFTIDRTNNTFATPSTDLSSNESYLLQVKHDVRAPNDIVNKNEETNKTRTSNETNIVTETYSKTPEVKSGSTLNLTRTTAAVSSTTENAKIPTISSDTVEVFDSVEYTRTYDKPEKPKNNGKESIKDEEFVLKSTERTVPNKQMTTIDTNYNKIQPPIEVLTVTDHVATETDQTVDFSTGKATATNNTQLYNVTEIPALAAIATEITTNKANNENDPIITEFSSITTDLPQTVFIISSVPAINIDDTSLPTEMVNLSSSDVIQTTTEYINTKITKPLSGNYQIYTAINRKRTTNSEETTVTSKNENDEMKAETSNTQVNFEKAYNVTPISSLEKLRVDLLYNTNHPSINSEISHGSEKVTREVELATQYTADSIEPKKLASVETKRAGYLDNSEKSTTPMIASISEEIKEIVTESYGAVDDRVAMETGSPDLKKVSGSESQSQLAEDALQEEFLKEEALNNHKENSIRYHDERTGMNVEKLSNPAAPAGTGTDDALSVQPIDRTKTTLYTPSPNYKPMKKIDVQPAKPFVRDPDDNSWRNESISSLGIVFKPKNSSISFKEVLKNKTQSELNSLIERTKDDVPDLRVRLEKIAEVRKTKKKKMNKDGEVVYTDYEENSAETISTPKSDKAFSILNSAEVANMLVATNAQQGSPTEITLDTTTPMTTLRNMEVTKNNTSHKFDIFSKLGLDSLTTLKPSKFFNIAEYYDTTDEYDADYVTMSKIDLKKFTVPLRSTRPAPLINKPVEPYVPERRPTVQYFPPREPLVNVNNVDKDFERKINMFTFNDHPSIEPRPPFVTLPPLPIATAKPDSEMRPVLPVRPPAVRPDMRPTMKPTDVMYPPAELNKNYYLTNAPTTTESEGLLMNSGRLDRGSYVIKHYKDFLNAAAGDDDRSSDFLPHHTTEQPRETFPTEVDRHTFRPRDDEEDYDTRFRKEVLTRFVDNFNQNSERFKVDFPILYNNSVVHRKGAGSPASSRTYLKRLYHEGVATRSHGLLKKPCEPNCELTVELSPAYELHYYVPNQEEREEREEQESRTATSPYRYGL